MTFRNLGCIAIDEQHRFGVLQRASLKKGSAPTMLTMTATPIPRTLALTLYGDLDYSVIDELPPGRKPVLRTAGENRKDAVYAAIKRKYRKAAYAYTSSIPSMRNPLRKPVRRRRSPGWKGSGPFFRARSASSTGG
ncbi:MAG: hypothetical protein MZU91_04950 [Desulfosudis oleivorans]|nr:hypothetical protein [Desulfosudis oleivorans]